MGQRTRPVPRCEFPIVDNRRRIVGWTRTVPHYIDGVLRHPEAEAILKGAVVAAYVEIQAPQEAVRAGAPAGWQGPWRCLGLCAPALADLKPANRQRSAEDGPRPS
jgi:hypothetical protein